MGLVFQVPVVILGADAAGNRDASRSCGTTGATRSSACAAVAAFLPGDVITLLLETVPLYLLYEASILLAAILERSRRRAEGRRWNCGCRGLPRSDPRPLPDDRRGTDRAADHRPHRREPVLMLFDLRGRGRRRTVKTIYIGLAVLIGVGLVGFGVGGGLGGGGILNATSGNEGAGGASFASKIKKYEKLTETAAEQPRELGTARQEPAARSRQRRLRHLHGGADEQGQGTLPPGLAGLDRLPRPEPAEPQPGTRPARLRDLQRSRPERTGEGRAGAATRGRTAARRRAYYAQLARVRLQGQERTPRRPRCGEGGRAWHRPPSARGSRTNWPKSRSSRTAARPT